MSSNDVASQDRLKTPLWLKYQECDTVHHYSISIVYNIQYSLIWLATLMKNPVLIFPYFRIYSITNSRTNGFQFEGNQTQQLTNPSSPQLARVLPISHTSNFRFSRKITKPHFIYDTLCLQKPKIESLIHTTTSKEYYFKNERKIKQMRPGPTH